MSRGINVETLMKRNRTHEKYTLNKVNLSQFEFQTLKTMLQRAMHDELDKVLTILDPAVRIKKEAFDKAMDSFTVGDTFKLHKEFKGIGGMMATVTTKLRTKIHIEVKLKDGKLGKYRISPEESRWDGPSHMKSVSKPKKRGKK